MASYFIQAKTKVTVINWAYGNKTLEIKLKAVCKSHM